MMLITADLHLTDRPRDGYRFVFLEWLKRAVAKYRVHDLIILGDLTDAKDRHSSVLVNRIADALVSLSEHVYVTILKGNHDYIDEGTPFFRWLRHQPKINFIIEPTVLSIDGKWGLFLPHTIQRKGYAEMAGDGTFDYVFVHQTFSGARSENGQKLAGISPAVFDGVKARIYSGDVHVPQRVGRVEYVGAPYHIRFGDCYQPRIILDDGESRDVSLRTVQRRMISIVHPEQLTDEKLRRGDQIKVEIRLPRSEFGCWEEYKQAVRSFAKRAGVDLCGLKLTENQRVRINLVGCDRREYLASAEDIFDGYCKRNAEQINSSLRAAGEKFL